MKLLSSAITFGKRFSTLTHIGQLATIGILVYLAYIMGTCSNRPDPDTSLQVTVEQTKQYASQLENTVKTLRDTVAQKETTITTLTVEIRRQRQQQTVARTRIATLDTISRRELATLPISTPTTDTLIALLREELIRADSISTIQDSIITIRTDQVKLLNIALDSALVRGDTLQRTLDQVFREHQRKNKLFGKIPLPSRKVVATAAFIGGTYLGVQAVK
jgi:hypothetical protein